TRARVVQILEGAGLRVSWFQPPIELEGPWEAPRSDVPNTFTITMLIRPRRVGGQSSAVDGVMGQAYEASETTGTSCVFFEQVRVAADQFHVPFPGVLAMAMAHEIGHLLLPRPAHSTTGIMLDTWRRQDIRQAAAGTLRFSSAEAA